MKPRAAVSDPALESAIERLRQAVHARWRRSIEEQRWPYANDDEAKMTDRSEYDRSTGYHRVRCSQCEALVIMGVPCHERGCPNAKRKKDEWEDE